MTCIVGPNGSGKSNVVDALAWVMGEQGAKTLRGGKMEDVIFAGTSTRGPLGRAEVQLTIDNSDGALPIEYSEVTISRTLFRNGASEYAINGDTCRLLDVQELLSDSGLGREMHVIVGQGRLDTVLQAIARRPPWLHRRGGRHPQAPSAQGEDPPQARRDGDQPHAPERPCGRAASTAQAARPSGRDRARGRDDRRGRARRQGASARRRPRGAAGSARRSRAQRAGAPHRATGAAGPGRRHPCPHRGARSRSAQRSRRRGAPRRVRARAGAGAPSRRSTRSRTSASRSSATPRTTSDSSSPPSRRP